MSRKVSVILGCCALALGALVTLSGIVLVVAFGSPDGLRTGPHPLVPPSRALVSTVADIRNAGASDAVLGQARIDVRAATRGSDRKAFVGIGPAAAVDRYLAGAAVEIVTDFEVAPFDLTTEPRPGSASLAAPGAQDFWVAQGETGSGAAQLSWTVSDGDYRLVIMNADGSPGVDVDGSFGIAVPAARPMIIAVLVVGLVLIAGGTLAL